MELPMDVVIGGRLKDKVNSGLVNLDALGLERNKVKSVNFTIDVRVDINITEPEVNFVSTVDLLEDWMASRNGVNVD